MKTTLKTSGFSWKSWALISTVTVLFISVCGFWGFSMMRAQYTSELKRYGNIAGAVLSTYPEAEQTLLDAMQDSHYSQLDKGVSILEKYGYRENMLMTDVPYYHSALISFVYSLVLFLALYLVLIAFLFFFQFKFRRKQELRLHEMLECFLADNYSLLADKETLEPIFSESFTDTLFKIGHKLMAKTQALAEERDHTKTLVTDISHQLKTPVSALKSCLTMCMETDTAEERDDLLHRCAQQMHKLENLLTVLVNISRLETYLISLHRETVPLSDLLTDAVNTVYEKALQKDIIIEVCKPDETNAASLSLLLDRRWSTEAVANILDNAVKYSPAGSKITLRIQKFCSYAHLEIADQGIGIPKEESNQIFHRFYRGSHPVIRQTEGSGVGLYLSRRIIEEQGGAVSVKSAAGKGSIFTVRFPL